MKKKKMHAARLFVLMNKKFYALCTWQRRVIDAQINEKKWELRAKKKKVDCIFSLLIIGREHRM